MPCERMPDYTHQQKAGHACQKHASTCCHVTRHTDAGHATIFMSNSTHLVVILGCRNEVLSHDVHNVEDVTMQLQHVAVSLDDDQGCI